MENIFSPLLLLSQVFCLFSIPTLFSLFYTPMSCLDWTLETTCYICSFNFFALQTAVPISQIASTILFCSYCFNLSRFCNRSKFWLIHVYLSTLHFLACNSDISRTTTVGNPSTGNILGLMSWRWPMMCSDPIGLKWLCWVDRWRGSMSVDQKKCVQYIVSIYLSIMLILMITNKIKND